MLDKSVRVKREELKNKSVFLSSIALDEKSDNHKEIRRKQDEIYSKWLFYDNFIKNMEKVERW